MDVKPFVVVLLGLSACSLTPVQQASLSAGTVTLAAAAAASNTTVDRLVTAGALFCEKADPLVPVVFALANAAGAPVSVTAQASEDVAAACAAVQAVPVSPPANAATVPVIPAVVALPAA